MIRSPHLSALPGIAHAFFTREGGVSDGVFASLNAGLGSGDDRDRVLENRARVSAALGVAPEALSVPYQIHSPDAVVLTDPIGPVPGPKADALVTDRPGLAIGILTADCGPILFADPQAKVIGAAHAGWKGALTGVMEQTLAAMEGLGADRARIVAVLGPSITQSAYEVGPEFVARFTDAATANERYFIASAKSGHAMFDLPGYTLDRLRAAGVGSVAALGLCTYADETRFYSYRRSTHRGEPDYGRLISAIALA